MTGNDKHTTYKNDDDWGMVLVFCFTHMISSSITVLYRFQRCKVLTWIDVGLKGGHKILALAIGRMKCVVHPVISLKICFAQKESARNPNSFSL